MALASRSFHFLSSTAFLLPSRLSSIASPPRPRSFAPRLAAPASPPPPPPPPARLSCMAGTASAPAAGRSLHDFTVKDINRNDVDLKDYKGKVLLIVNVASECGLTNSNYTELAKLYEEYQGRNFEVLAFPCNQFGGQEPGTNEQIKEFACTRFKAEYPIFDKVEVNGPGTAPLYVFLKSKKSGFLGKILGDDIKWNFEKFLVNKNGQVTNRYAPTTSPLKIKKDIDKLLDE